MIMNNGNRAIIIGWINKNKPADCGETMKNQLMIQKLEELGVKCYLADFKNWRKHPWIFLQLLWYMIAHHDATLIFSTSTQNVYPMMNLMKLIRWKQHTVHWVIGGSLGQKVKDGVFQADIIGYMNYTLVESNLMKQQLTKCGIKNVLQVPNFKPISYYPTHTGGVNKVRFIFLSRIMPEKGCDYILKAAKLLNEKGYIQKYEIDFYGKIAESYQDTFERGISLLSNVHYAGFLNLRENSGYDKLANYDVMLFPTYWKGEGFAGIFIDAFISGVPIIASDWSHNRQFLKENETALFIPVHDVQALEDKMRECIDGKYDLKHMSSCCQKQAKAYNVDNVITIDFLKRIGIIKL